MEKLNMVFKAVEKNRENMISLQKDLTAVPAIAPQSKGQGEWNKAQVLIKHLNELGIKNITTINALDKRVPDGKRPNIIATVPGEEEGRHFWIMTHIDVVPPGELSLWDSAPFTVIEKEDRLIGRGVEDNQQSMVSSIFAVKSILENGFKPKYTVKLLFVADEETGSDFGIKFLLENYSLFKKGDLILVPDGGRADGTLIEIAEKSILWLKFTTRGKQCHASMPSLGINAFVAGSELVLALNGLNDEFNRENTLFDPPVSTFSPTKKEANVPNINSIPGDDVFYLDCRILPEYNLDTILKRITEIKSSIEKKYGVAITFEVVQRESSPPTPENSHLVQSLKKAVKRVYNVNAIPSGIGGGTVAAHLRSKGFDTVVWSKIDETAHMPNEYCLIDNMIGDCKVMAEIMLEG
ncbi:MAG: M20 family metallo-hydrolase [Spirochaetales bacterium]|nr:M20 family metallo-hydrolase [Spirochaetales bacterium]